MGTPHQPPASVMGDKKGDAPDAGIEGMHNEKP
jgi:hypothetical protein